MARGCAFVALVVPLAGIVLETCWLCSPKLLDYQRFMPCAEIIPSFSIRICCNGSHDITAQQMLLPQYGLI